MGFLCVELIHIAGSTLTQLVTAAFVCVGGIHGTEIYCVTTDCCTYAHIM